MKDTNSLTDSQSRGSGAGVRACSKDRFSQLGGGAGCRVELDGTSFSKQLLERAKHDSGIEICSDNGKLVADIPTTSSSTSAQAIDGTGQASQNNQSSQSASSVNSTYSNDGAKTTEQPIASGHPDDSPDSFGYSSNGGGSSMDSESPDFINIVSLEIVSVEVQDAQDLDTQDNESEKPSPPDNESEIGVPEPPSGDNDTDHGNTDHSPID